MIETNFLVNVKKYYIGLPHQKKAVKIVDDFLGSGSMLELNDCDLIELQTMLEPELLTEVVNTWRTPPPPPIKPENWQSQPFNTQLDNPIAPHSTCNSSAHWMMARSINPRIAKSDSTYVRQVMSGKFGRKGTRNPSIYWDVHVRGLAYYGVKIQVMTGNLENAIKQAQSGICTPTNLLHRGHISNPHGGHIVCIVGYNSEDDRLRIHDPYGELDYINGTSDLSKSGKYWVTKRNFLRRWQGNWSKKV